MNDKKTWQLFRMLAKGGFHSGQAMAQELGISRAAVWKLKKSLEEKGVEIQSVRGRGYRLDPPPELLDEAALRAAAPGITDWALNLDMQLDSTSAWLWKALDADQIHSGTACLAEFQTAGRGRRGRTWFSPPGKNLYMSLYWRFDTDPSSLNGLSLALGLAVAQALESLGLKDVGLKWPNDVQVRGRKLAGLLVDLRGQSGGPVDVVVGLGLNHQMNDDEPIDQPWTDMTRCMLQATPGRNRTAGVLLEAMAKTLSRYAADELSDVLDAWKPFDVLAEQAVNVHGPIETVSGVAKGLAEDGSIRVEVDGQIRHFASGEVSIRRPL